MIQKKMLNQLEKNNTKTLPLNYVPSEPKKTLTSALLLVVCLLLGIGLVQVYSSSFVYAIETYNDGLFFFKRQLFYVFISASLLIFSAKIPFKYFEKWTWLLWFLASCGLVLTLVPGIGVKAGGAARWIQLPFGFRVEPSELLKISFPFIIASFFDDRNKWVQKMNWIVRTLIVVVPLGLLLVQPDFGSFVIISAVGMGLLFAFGLKWRFIFASILMAIPAFYFLIMRVPYRRARVLSFLDPWSDPEQKGFQAIQSMLSFHSGGFWGVGIGEAQGKLFFLPEAHTDFTLAIFGEEMGFVGFFILLSLYGFLVYRLIKLSLITEILYERIFLLGSAMVFALNVFINAGVVMGLLPPKGLTLPFLSYGGSSVIVLSFLFSLIISLERKIEAYKDVRQFQF